MNTDRLIKYLKNDLSELTEIFSELKPGVTLSSLEIKMILNRINSVNEEFQLLENEMNNGKVNEKQNGSNPANEKPITENAIKKEPIPQENTVDVNDTIKEKTSEDVSAEAILKTDDKQIESSEKPTEEEITPEIEVEESIAEDQVEVIEEEPNEVIEEEIETLEEDISENDETIELSAEPKQTIADKYQGSTSSLNDHIANHIELKDLASKLQQEPIDDLTKAIKLNDKIWYSNELFDGNLDLYRETIRTVNKMEELEEALAFLESNFSFNQTKKSFKSFIEIIYRRFLK